MASIICLLAFIFILLPGTSTLEVRPRYQYYVPNLIAILMIVTLEQIWYIEASLITISILVPYLLYKRDKAHKEEFDSY